MTWDGAIMEIDKAIEEILGLMLVYPQFHAYYHEALLRMMMRKSDAIILKAMETERATASPLPSQLAP